MSRTLTALSPHLDLFRPRPDQSTLHRSSPYYRAAYATFLSAPISNTTDDGYLLGALLLAYALLHDPTTRTVHDLPLLILTTPDVSPSHLTRLTALGAAIIPVPHLHAPGITPGSLRWRDVLSKLHLFNLTAYRKICFLDADTLVTGALDGVFEDAGTMMQYTAEDAAQLHADEAPLPGKYIFAAHAEALGFYDHAIPPPPHDYLNAGFFVLGPSTTLFEYYTSLLNASSSPTPKFSGTFPEQDLLNYAHRRSGNMPWTSFEDWRWNVNWPTRRDLEAGARSFHAKYWEERGTGGHDDVLWDLWNGKKREMEDWEGSMGTGRGHGGSEHGVGT